jgi:diaminopimelate decarboxylase
MQTTAGTALTDVFHYVDGKLFCEGVSAEDLVATHGTPLYVYSETAILERYHAFVGAFAELDPLIAYSVKANGNLEVLRLLRQAGAGADKD